MSRVFKARAQKFGGHWDVTVFVAKTPDQTYASCGTLTMSSEDYTAFREKFNTEHSIREAGK